MFCNIDLLKCVLWTALAANSVKFESLEFENCAWGCLMFESVRCAEVWTSNFGLSNLVFQRWFAIWKFRVLELAVWEFGVWEFRVWDFGVWGVGGLRAWDLTFFSMTVFIMHLLSLILRDDGSSGALFYFLSRVLLNCFSRDLFIDSWFRPKVN